jgi:hypothetical protein
MKLMIRIALSVCIAALSAAPASACWLYPFGGWWGAGYYGSPAYSAPMYSSYYAPSYTSYYGSPSYTSYYGSTSYASSYGSFSSPSYGCCGNSAPVYTASYGSYGGGCCDNSCCQSSCGSGCASNSCVGTTPAGTLKPAQDPISDRKTPDYEDNDSRRFVPRSTPRNNDALDPVNEPDRLDPFVRPGTEDGARPNPGTGAGSGRDPGGMFDDGIDPARERTNQKPPMSDPLNEEELDPIKPELGNPVDEKTFFDDTSTPDNTTYRGSNAVMARTSSLSEVIAPKRLASRSLPASLRPVSSSALADKSNNPKSDSPRPIRWISAPLADGHVQL